MAEIYYEDEPDDDRYDNYENALRANGGREPHQCEYCLRFFLYQPFRSQERNGKSEFCSDNCVTDFEWEVRIGREEAKEQWELYGDDFDSWYR
jgi:hypothetical protein